MPEPSRKARWASDVRGRLSSLQLSPAREAEIVEELSQHLADRYQELISAGESEEDATRLTLAAFRSSSALAQCMAPLRQAHPPPPITIGAGTGRLLRDVWQDVRYAVRISAKQPGFAATAVLTLALGIGASTALFSVVYGVLLKPLPFHEADALVSVTHRGLDRILNHGHVTFLTYREHQQAFEAIGAWDTRQVSITGGGDPERVEALQVSDAALPLLRVQPVAGRLFSAADDAPGSPRRAMLTHAYGQRRFGGARNAVGQLIEIDGNPTEVIGVLPASFRFLRTDAAVLLPLQVDPAAPPRVSFGFQALARLKPGVTMPQANADLGRMISLLPDTFDQLQLQPHVRPLADEVIGDVGEVLWILLAAAGVVLMIACGNVANLFLVRAEGRQQEFAMRAALGASRGRLARALLSESVVLALAGGALGIVLASACVGLLRRMAPAELPRVEEIAIDGTALLFTLSISVMSGLLFGLFAVMRFGKPGMTALKESGRSTSDGPGRHRTRNVLVVAQIALAVVLLIVSGLMIRTFGAMRDVHPGFTQPEEVQTFRIAIPDGLVSDPQQAARMHEGVAERLSQVPGVRSVGLSTSITLDGEDNANYLAVQEFPDAEGVMPTLRRFKSFAPGYFETMGIPLVAGRSITWTEIHERRPLIVISQTIAREYWGDPSKALGKRVRGSSPTAPWREIVGVVGDERDDGLSHPATAIVYWPMLNESYRWRIMGYAVRSSRVGAPGFVRELRQAAWSVNPNLPLAEVRTLAEIHARSMADTSFAMVMLAIAAAVALLVGVVGIYSMNAYVAAQRTREIGLRMALGAQGADVQKMFLRHGLGLIAIGIALGTGAAALIARVMSALLFGVAPRDPITYVAVSGVLALVALVATYVPARRASRIDPIIALRADA